MTKPKYSTFDLSHERKFSGNMGELIPMLVMETVPGDSFDIRTAQMIRFAPMIAPMMHHVTVYQHFFFVPNRITWDNWEQFITSGEDGQATCVIPYVTIEPDDITEGSLGDYLGLPMSSSGSKDVQILPLLAYNRIYNEYYRDQNLITEIPDIGIDGDQSGTALHDTLLAAPQKRAWQHDYFTSALPWTQKGPEATIPLGTSAPIDFDDAGGLGTFVKDASGNVRINMLAGTTQTTATGQLEFEENGPITPYNIDNSALLSADLSSATAATINDLRTAFRLQEWLEKNARGGTRYVESILSHFGVRSSDARLQRPEFLGGGSVPISISEVLQTGSTDATTPQGNMAGHGIAAGQNASFHYRCEEHGYIIGIMSIRPKTAYQDGIPKHFLKFDKFDYYWPAFAHLGEQPIDTCELFFDHGLAPEIFGYTPRYAEYKYMSDTVHGQYRTTLDFWHMGRKFTSAPTLSQQFIECDPTTRIFAVTEGSPEQMYIHVHHAIRGKRPMPFFGTPIF